MKLNQIREFAACSNAQAFKQVKAEILNKYNTIFVGFLTIKYFYFNKFFCKKLILKFQRLGPTQTPFIDVFNFSDGYLMGLVYLFFYITIRKNGTGEIKICILIS